MCKTLALVLSAAAVAASLHLVLSAPRHREILQRKRQDLERIRTLARRWEAETAFCRQLDARQAWVPADLEEVATRTLGAGVAKISPRTAEPVAGGWQRRETSVEMSDVPYAEAMLFLMAAAEHAPAWRLRGLEMRPSAEAGKGACTVVLEALEKEDAARPESVR